LPIELAEDGIHLIKLDMKKWKNFNERFEITKKSRKKFRDLYFIKLIEN
jgi:hypothetical protein